MSKQCRFEVVRSDAGFFARFVAANGAKVWQTEVYTRRHNAKKAVTTVAQAFALTPARWTFRGDRLFIYAGGVGAEVVEVDERTPIAQGSDT